MLLLKYTQLKEVLNTKTIVNKCFWVKWTRIDDVREALVGK